jgi:hypothetical protein
MRAKLESDEGFACDPREWTFQHWAFQHGFEPPEVSGHDD